MQEVQTEKLQPIQMSRLPDSPLVSVVIANYNYDKYISETLESVLSQTYQNFEIIVCDDGSTDNSCDVIANYVRKDSRIKLISKQNGGVASALNAAYRESKGQIICLLDADDVWMDRKLEKVVEAFKSDPQYGFVIHNVMQIDGQGNLLRPTPMFKHLSSGWIALEALENGGSPQDVPPASALSVRREIAELIFPLNEIFRRNADSLVSYLAPFITVIESIPEALSKFRFHGGNTTSQVTSTVDSLERSQSVFEAVHREQKLFLRRVYGEVFAQKLTSLSLNLLVCHDRYLIARLKGIPKAKRQEIHRQLVNHPQFYSFSSPHQKWLLKWGEYLPDILFAPVFKLVYGSGKLKSWVRKLLAR
ncbi:MAG: glycosyltransferase [Pelatocladus maniniholoensis HA4357-MV3]|jgi:glycosyltransferase involved in cell wall biosynthesis|uniref:Glycosyltransferase n=1 Tax=Pelatocladus maniniholoensis HA4357-MV3 TaxID=1117104 RepID=A0A9E3H6I6_9NOST|nr:glycosyltransferase [Pelatocladus maniniholoensis HA4357-MV3]